MQTQLFTSTVYKIGENRFVFNDRKAEQIILAAERQFQVPDDFRDEITEALDIGLPQEKTVALVIQLVAERLGIDLSKLRQESRDELENMIKHALRLPRNISDEEPIFGDIYPY